MKKILRAFVIVIACAWPVAGASAQTILFAGGEDSDFTLTGASAAFTTPGLGAGFSRASIQFGVSGTVTWPPASYAMSPTFAASSAIWVHAYLNAPGSLTNSPTLAVYSPDGVPRIVVRAASSTAGQYKISTRNAAGTFADLATMPSGCFAAGVTKGFDLYINYAVSGQVTLYCGGVSYASYTGNVTTDSATQLNQILLSTPTNNCCGTAFWAEIIVATTDTRNMRLVTLAPSANGNTHNFDVDAVANVDETVWNTSNSDASGAAGEIDEYKTNALPSGLWNVLGVWVNAQAEVDTTGPQHLQAMVRTQSTDYTSSNLSPPQGSWGWISNNWTTNPYTGVAWTTSDLATTNLNIGFESQN